ncbi:hypothetical protein NKOR_06975 [Candidatus Nitrosopumilus koreensis AR1]|uniref:Uncharacterized protein n=1 Tax=Candidatus Nitrosopumilus koreensis AR1 TaxID=1229908 RepID=K0B9X9_9ARCH|nr:hypothetical protein NKOR_06975 [Candidatus Nitrosopumilus koreensis AR1]
MSFFIDGIFFMIELFELIAEQHNEIVLDSDRFSNLSVIVSILSTFFLPFATSVFGYNAKIQLAKHGIVFTKSWKDYPFTLVTFSTLTFIFGSIHVIIINNGLFR